MTEEIPNKPNVKQAVPFFMVADMQASLDFYCKGLGFEVKIDWKPNGTIEWCWIEIDGVALMLQEYRNNAPAEKRGLGVSVCFICDDALKIYNETIARGLSAEEPFVGNNSWVVGFKDPDDYSILFESPTAVPEETMYSEWSKQS